VEMEQTMSVFELSWQYSIRTLNLLRAFY